MRAGLPIGIGLLAASALPAAAQAPSNPSEPAPVISCTSLANLRAVLRDAKDDGAAAIPVVTDPKSDLGCDVLDRKTVTGLADHVALNGRAYDCLTLQNTEVCHWTVAGAVDPQASAPRPSGPAPTPPKPKR